MGVIESENIDSSSQQDSCWLGDLPMELQCYIVGLASGEEKNKLKRVSPSINTAINLSFGGAFVPAKLDKKHEKIDEEPRNPTTMTEVANFGETTVFGMSDGTITIWDNTDQAKEADYPCGD